MTPRSRGLAIATALLSSLLLAACGGGDDTGTSATSGSGKLEKTTIKVGALPIPDPAALYVANKKGFFKEEGLTVEPVTIQGGAAALPQIKSGALDISHTNYVSTFLAASKGEKIKIVGDVYQAAPNTFNLMVPKDSPLQSVADLKGKTILVNTLKNIGTLSVEATLKVAGLTAADVKFVEKPFPEMGNALLAGQGDAAWMTEPGITAAQSKLGFRKLADTMSGETENMPIAAWMATEEWVKNNPNTLAAFQRAIAKAQAIVAKDRKEVEAVLPTYTQIDAKTASVITLGSFPTSLNESRLQRVADLMLAYKYIDKPLDVKSMLAGPTG
ncbi:ABC transporter substrate-binding protein [Thermoactinospora rubra]|uniref:ABC transporter substrate-binding protein n=1 Tax=Thermoactinospora rubra TaxID=1088767 RepID=UPI000A0FFDD6|nr:ABC transporter substrate-binding protein [Thermoactinospora rubra]